MSNESGIYQCRDNKHILLIYLNFLHKTCLTHLSLSMPIWLMRHPDYIPNFWCIRSHPTHFLESNVFLSQSSSTDNSPIVSELPPPDRSLHPPPVDELKLLLAGLWFVDELGLLLQFLSHMIVTSVCPSTSGASVKAAWNVISGTVCRRRSLAATLSES